MSRIIVSQNDAGKLTVKKENSLTGEGLTTMPQTQTIEERIKSIAENSVHSECDMNLCRSWNLNVFSSKPNEPCNCGGEELRQSYIEDLTKQIQALVDEVREEYENMGFRPMFQLLKRWLDINYPADVFTGVSGDIGAKMIVQLRAFLEKHKERIR